MINSCDIYLDTYRFLNVTKAQTESVVEPHAMADDLRRKPMATVVR
jgi:hypothetical protein